MKQEKKKKEGKKGKKKVFKKTVILQEEATANCPVRTPPRTPAVWIRQTGKRTT